MKWKRTRRVLTALLTAALILLLTSSHADAEAMGGVCTPDTGPRVPEPEPEPGAIIDIPDPVLHRPFAWGYRGLFRPDDPVTRGELAAMAARLLGNARCEVPEGPSPFPDTAENAWYTGYIGYLRGLGILLGRDTGLFDPEAPATSGELTLVLRRMAALLDRPAPADLPEGTVTRARAAALLAAPLDRPGPYCPAEGEVPFTDVPRDHPLYAAILEASVVHITE